MMSRFGTVTHSLVFATLLGACSGDYRDNHRAAATGASVQSVGDGTDPVDPPALPVEPDLSQVKALNAKGQEIKAWLAKNAVEVIDKKDWWVDATLFSSGVLNLAKAQANGEGRSFNLNLRLYKIVIHSDYTQKLKKVLVHLEHVENRCQSHHANQFVVALFYDHVKTREDKELKPLRDEIAKLREEYLAIRAEIQSRYATLDEHEADLVEGIDAQFGNIFLRLTYVNIPEEIHAYKPRHWWNTYSVFNEFEDETGFVSHWAEKEDFRFF